MLKRWNFLKTGFYEGINLGEFIAYQVGKNYAFVNGEIAHSANATEPLSRISRSRLDVVWMYFGDYASDDWAAIQEVKTTGQASLDLADDLINDYNKLFGDDHRVRLQSRLTGLMNVLDELGRGDLSPRLAALGGLGPDSAAGIKLYPTLLHDSGIESSDEDARYPPGNHGARLVIPRYRLLVNWSGPNRPSTRTASSRSIVMPLPSWVDFATAQQFAAVMSRELSGSSETWATLFSHAQAVLASRTSTRESEGIDIYDLDEWNDLVCAARILDSAATEKGVKEQGDRDSGSYFGGVRFRNVRNRCVGEGGYPESPAFTVGIEPWGVDCARIKFTCFEWESASRVAEGVLLPCLC